MSDANYILIYGNKETGMKQEEEVPAEQHYYVMDDGKWESIPEDTDEWTALQSAMAEHNYAFILVPHQAITVNENDEVVGITLPESS